MARVRKTREFVGRAYSARIDKFGNLCVEYGVYSEDVLAEADEVSEFAAWLGQEIDRHKRSAPEKTRKDIPSMRALIGGEDDGA